MTEEELINHVRSLIDEHTRIEDNKIRIKNAFKYDIFNLFEEYDTVFIKHMLDDKGYEE